MKIAFDAKRFFHNTTGLGNYSRFVVDSLANHSESSELLLCDYRPDRGRDLQNITSKDKVKIFAGTRWRRILGKSVWRSCLISQEPCLGNYDVFHGLSAELPWGLSGKIKKVVTIHDLIFMRLPHLFNAIDRWVYLRKVKAACQAADVIVAVSQQTAQDLLDLVDADQSKIQVVGQGCHSIFRTPRTDITVELRRKLNLSDRFVLNVGTIERRKNAELILKAMSLLDQKQQLPIVIVGKDGAYKKELEHWEHSLNLAYPVRYFHKLGLEDLAAMYRAAELFIYPSLFEGFGIPLIESVSSGVPAIASQGTCFEEVLGSGSYYVDPLDPKSLAAVLEELLQSDSERHRLWAQQHLHIQRFSPESVSQKLVDVYR